MICRSWAGTSPSARPIAIQSAGCSALRWSKKAKTPHVAAKPISAHLPTRVVDLQPYFELITSMIDMVRNEVIPSLEEITDHAVAEGVMHPPDYQQVR